MSIQVVGSYFPLNLFYKHYLIAITSWIEQISLNYTLNTLMQGFKKWVPTYKLHKIKNNPRSPTLRYNRTLGELGCRIMFTLVVLSAIADVVVICPTAVLVASLVIPVYNNSLWLQLEVILWFTLAWTNIVKSTHH